VQPCDQQARGDGPVAQRRREAQQLVPLLVDEVRFDAVAQPPAGGAVLRSSDVPEPAVGEAARRGANSRLAAALQNYGRLVKTEFILR
jgi:hypothetical protein